MRIRFLYFDECPSHEEALQRLMQVMEEESIMTKVEVIRINTEEQAVKLRFPGSPTIFIDGEDIDPSAEPHHALACRAYRLEDGRISPLPSIGMIRRALQLAKRRSALK